MCGKIKYYTSVFELTLLRLMRSTRRIRRVAGIQSPVRVGLAAVAVALLGAFFWFLALPRSSDTASPPAMTFDPPDPVGAVADLDGDNVPDLAIVSAKGRGPKGFQYQLELHLSARPALSSLSITARERGLRIVARDVDGDGDLDLVITSALSLAPVEVWINDGHGRFTKGNPAAYPSSIWGEGLVIFSETAERAMEAGLLPPCHDCAGFSDQHRPCRLPVGDDGTPLELAPFHASNVAGAPKTRSPPLVSS